MKKKILIIGLVMCTVCASFAASGFTIAGAYTLDAADQCFIDYIAVKTPDQLSYERKPLYDEELVQNGWQYDFSVNGKNGYALITGIVLNEGVSYEMEEFRLGAESPFDACIGIPVYITHKTYIDYYNEAYYNIVTGEIISGDNIINYAEIGFGYNGDGGYYDVPQTISYSSKATTQEYKIQYDLPNYSGSVGSTNCANVAGSVAIGYYDRFCTELVPNFQTYRMIGLSFQYKSMGPEIGAVQNRLYTLMSTDNGQTGTTYNGFQNGMNSYAGEHGYSYSIDNLFSWGSFDFEKCKTALHAGKPVAFFMTNYAIVSSISTSGTTDTIISSRSDVAHVAMCCGYRVDTYYNSSGGVISNRIYLRIVVGLQNVVSDIGYLNINGLTTINHATSIYIS